MRFMLTFLRHGETDWNAQWKCQGQQDIPLNTEGLEQAKIVGKYLKEEKFDYIFTSDLQRCIQTIKGALAEGSSADLELIEDKRLRERSFGVYEGMSFDIYFQAIKNCVGQFVIEGGETPEQVLVRTIDFLNDMCKQVKTQELNKANAAKSSTQSNAGGTGGSEPAASPAESPAAAEATSKVFVSEQTGENRAARTLPHVLLSTHGFLTRNFLKYLHAVLNVPIPDGEWLIDDGCPNTSLSTFVAETDADGKLDFQKLLCYFIYKTDHFGQEHTFKKV